MKKRLVTYFSAEGTTAKVAARLAETIGADLFEIKPEKPYTAADIKWTNPLSRCNKEKFGKKEVAIASKIENFDQYETVFIGFPIWYGGAPNAVGSFVKQYDWTGKKVALFATSGGSAIGKTAEKLAPCFSGKGEIIDAKLFSVTVSADELKAWAESL